MRNVPHTKSRENAVTVMNGMHSVWSIYVVKLEIGAVLDVPKQGRIAAVAVGTPALLVALWLAYERLYQRWVP